MLTEQTGKEGALEPGQYRQYGDDIQYAKYKNGSHHLYEVDPATGNKHQIGSDISSDKYLESWGYDPYVRTSPDPSEATTDDPTEKPADTSELEEKLKKLETKIDGLEAGMGRLVEAITTLSEQHREQFEEQIRLLGKLPEELTAGKKPPKTPEESPDIRTLHEEIQALKDELAKEREDHTVRDKIRDEQMDELIRLFKEMLDKKLKNDEPPPPPPPPPPSRELLPPQEKLAEAQAVMETNRDALADITIRRRGRMDDRWRAHRKQDLALYEEAMSTYKESVAEYLRARGDVLEAGDPNNPETAPPNEIEIQRELLIHRYAEQREFKKAEGKKNEALYEAVVAAGGMKARYARLLRWWSNQSTGKKILIGLGVGGLAFLATGPLGLGAAAVAGGSAAKFSLGVLNRSASARNRSPQSVEREIGRITRDEERSLLYFSDNTDRENLIAAQTGGLESDLNRDVVRAQRRNRIGNALMVAGAGAAAVGAANALMDHWPFGWPGGGGNSVDMSNFHPDSFQGGGTGVKTLEHAFGIFERNNIQVHGLTPERLAAINQDLVARHFPMASGMGPDGLQNIVDWTAGSAPNINASNLEGLAKVDGSSVGSWIELKNIAESHGVTFTKKA